MKAVAMLFLFIGTRLQLRLQMQMWASPPAAGSPPAPPPVEGVQPTAEQIWVTPGYRYRLPAKP